MNGSVIPLQDLSPSQTQTNEALPYPPTVTNGNSGLSHSHSVQSSRWTAFLRILTSFTDAVRSLLQSFRNQFTRVLPCLPHALDYWHRPLISLAVYALALHTALSAPKQHALLGRVSPSLGTWILAIFAKAGDICFAFAIEDTFDTIAWRKLGQRNRNHDFVQLEEFLSTTSSTGIEGLTRLLWRRSRVRRWILQCFGRCRGVQDACQSRESENASWERKLRDWWKRGRIFRWPFARLLFLAVMVPGPGIILMANVDQATVYFNVNSTNVSSGLALFDPIIANTTRDVVAPLISRYINGLLQDRSLSWPVDPIDNECSSDKDCGSFLIAGPYSTTSPWPFPSVDENLRWIGFRIKNAPFYQVDMWDVSPDTVNSSESANCAVYGGLDAAFEYSTQLCVTRQGDDGVLAAGWASCQLGYSPVNGSCLAPGARKDWKTFFRFYRRNATLTFSRSDLSILAVSDLSAPQIQNIAPAALFTAFDAFLYRPDRADSLSRIYDKRSAEYLLTQTIGVQLWSSLYNNSAGLNVGRDWLKNLVSLPVYVFQPTFLALAPYLPVLAADNGTLPQPNLPKENYVDGAYCVIDKRSIPGLGTVYAYAIVAGVLLMFVIVAKGRALAWRDVATSDFAVLDYHLLTNLVDNRRDAISLRDLMRHADGEYGTSKILDQVQNLRIGLG